MNTFFSTIYDKITGRNVPLGKIYVNGTPNENDMTGGLAADGKMLDGIYHGQNTSYNLAMGLIYAPIAVPVQLVACPGAKAIDDDKKTQLIINDVISKHIETITDIETTKHVQGTAWRWIWYDSRSQKIIWEMIPDQSIEKLDLDIYTGDIKGVYTYDQYKVATGEITDKIIYRKRHITKDFIKEEWTGDTAGLDIPNRNRRNPFHFLPEPFPHDATEESWRGHPAIGRNLRIIKSVHDIYRTACEILVDFKPKFVQSVTDPATWMKNNGKPVLLDGVKYFGQNSMKVSFLLNLFGKEKSEYLHLPADATKQHIDMINKLTQNCMSAGGIPEIFYGNLATGNQASVDAHEQLGVSYVNKCRQEDVPHYDVIFNQVLAIQSFLDSTRYSEVKTSYGALSLMSKKDQAEVFAKVSQGISMIVSGCGGTKDDILFFWHNFFPHLPEETIEKFEPGMDKMAIFKAMTEADLGSVQDMQNK